MSGTTILYLGPSDLRQLVASEFPSFEVRHASTETQVDEIVADCVGVMDASMRIRFDAERIGRARALRVYATATTGATHVDQSALASRGIPLLTLQGQSEFLRNITPAAELSWMLLMMCARQARPAIQHVLEGKWDRTMFPGHMLNGRSIGIIGCGRIGQWMARYATAFGMTVRGCDPAIADWPAGIQRCGMQEALSESDFVTIHVGFSEDLRGMIGAEQIRMMKRGCIFINTSRGELVDEQALADAVADGHIGGVGIDVLRGEPDTAAHPLVALARDNPRVVVTPHIGGFSPDALARVVRFGCGRLRSALTGVSA